MADDVSPRWLAVMERERLADGDVVATVVAGHPMVLVNAGGTLHALAGLCPHDHAPLGGGVVRGDSLECPRHQARFSLATGECVGGFTLPPLATYPVRARDAMVEVDVGAIERDPPRTPVAARWDLTRR